MTLLALILLACIAIPVGAAVYLLRNNRIVIAFRRNSDMSAIDDLNAAVTKVQGYVSTLQGEVASSDQSAAIESATAALNALVPAAVEQPQPEIDPNTGLPVTEQPA